MSLVKSELLSFHISEPYQAFVLCAIHQRCLCSYDSCQYKLNWHQLIVKVVIQVSQGRKM